MKILQDLMTFQLAVSTLVTQRSIFDIEMYGSAKHGSAVPLMPSIKYVGHFTGGPRVRQSFVGGKEKLEGKAGFWSLAVCLSPPPITSASNQPGTQSQAHRPSTSSVVSPVCEAHEH